MITIRFPEEVDADYSLIHFQKQNPKLGQNYFTAQLTKRDGKSDRVGKIFYEGILINPEIGISDEDISHIISILDRKNPDCIDIDRTNGIVSVCIHS